MRTENKELMREALMRLLMCARRECKICKYKTDNKEKMPSKRCKELALKNANILADAVLRDMDEEES